MNLYERIKQVRNERNLSQEELANMSGYTDRSSIAKIESGNVDLTISKLKAIAKALQVSPGYLLGIEDVSKDIKVIDITNKASQLDDLGRDKMLSYSEDLFNSGLYKSKPTRDDMIKYLESMQFAASDGIPLRQLDDNKLKEKLNYSWLNLKQIKKG